MQILGWLWKPIRVNAAFFVFMFVLGYLCTQTEIRLHLRGAKPYELSAVELFFDLYLTCVFLTLMPQKIRKWIRLLFAIILYVVALIDMFCYVHFESTLTPTMLMLFFETTGQEASEFLNSYVGWDLLTSKTGWIFLIAGLHILWAVLSAWWKKHHPSKEHCIPQQAIPYLQAGLGVIVLGLFIYCTTQCLPNKQAIHRLMTKSNLGEVEHELTTKGCADLYLCQSSCLSSDYPVDGSDGEGTGRQL